MREGEIMNKKKLAIIVTTVLFLCIFGIVLMFINSFWGNPISAAIATRSIKSYVKETYPDMDLEISDAKYNFKFNSYVSWIQSKTSKDTNFTVDWSDGAIYDSYEYDVLGRYRTFERLSTEFSQKVVEIVRKEFKYETSILYGDFGKSELDLSKLTLDMPLDFNNLPLPTDLTVYIMSDEISYEVLSAHLLELYRIMESHQIPIDQYTVVIEEPIPGEAKSALNGESLHLIDFPSEKIESEDLIAVIKEHQKAYEAEHTK